MKLNLFFIIMDLLTILAYPFAFVYYKLHQFSKLQEVNPE
jgi:NADH:ubiquinone oxidoreductase subunit 3 (subunit A)